MKVSFKNSFSSDFNNDFTNVPKDVIKAINETLPSGLEYTEFIDNDGGKKYKIKATGVKQSGSFSIAPETLNQLPDDIKKSPNLILDYLYRTQKPVEVTSVKVGNEENSIPIEFIDDDYLSPSHRIGKVILLPTKFPLIEPLKMSVDSYELSINVERVPYDNMHSIKIESSSDSVIKLIIICPDNISENNPLKISCTVYPKKAKTINEVISALNIYKGYINGKLMINGARISKPYATQTSISVNEIDKELQVWNTFEKLEKILSIHILPNTDFSLLDQKLFNELSHCLIEKKPLIYIRPFNSFQILTSEKESLSEILREERSAISFIEKNELSFMGNKIVVFSASVLMNFRIKEISDNNDGNSTVYIEGDPIEEYKLYKYYVTTEEEANTKIADLMKQSK